MHPTKYQFMRGVLGEEGAKALEKAAERSVSLENVLLPRTILAWLNLASRNDGYEGGLPGIENTYLQFSKAEDSYSGSIGIEGDVYTFDGASVYHVAASIAVALGVDHESVDPSMHAVDLSRVGKTIDILSKTHAVVHSLQKGEVVPLRFPWKCKTCSHEGKSQVIPKKCPKCTSEADSDHGPQRMQKAEAPGPAHAPTPQGQPQQPMTPAKQPRQKRAPNGKVSLPKVPGAPKLPSVKVTKAESEVQCRDCGRAQFAANRFTGCYCFTALSKDVKATVTGEDFTLEFKGDWDRESVAILLKSMGK